MDSKRKDPQGSGHDGQAVLERKKSGAKGYVILDPKHEKRIIDAVARKDIRGIKRVIEYLANYEIGEGFTEKEMPRGFQRLLRHYQDTENQINEMSPGLKDATGWQWP